MKTTRFTTILRSSLIACALTIGTLASTQMAAAQSGDGLALANIPFTFQTGNAHMPGRGIQSHTRVRPPDTASRTR